MLVRIDNVQDPKIQIKDGDVLITKDGTLGKVAQVNNFANAAAIFEWRSFCCQT